MGILSFLKKIIKQILFFDKEAFSQVTLEFFHQRKRKMHPKEYLNFLRNEYGFLWSLVDDRLMEGINIPEHWVDKIILLEKEIEETARLIGQDPFRGKKS